jgi:hypothetical protein
MLADVSSSTDGLNLLSVVLAGRSLHTSDGEPNGKEHFERAAYENLESCHNNFKSTQLVCACSYRGILKQNIQVLLRPTARICHTTSQTLINSGTDVHNSYCQTNLILVYNGAISGNTLPYILQSTA